MKFSESWVREWVNPKGDTDSLVTQLTMAGLEVDSVEPVSGPLENVILAEIISVDTHPNSENLKICLVDTGSDQLQIVCGAPNATPGIRVALASIGAVLPSGEKITKASIRGIESLGMLCSEKELGLSEENFGIAQFPLDAPIGASIYEYLGLSDSVIDVDLTPNRGDCLSILGVAREVGFLNEIDITRPDFSSLEPKVKDKQEIEIICFNECPKYLGQVLKGIDPKVLTPVWMKEKLRRAGLRSVDPVVDVTNYVMLELGQPLHAYDFDKLEGKISVRRSTKGEEIVLLGGNEIAIEQGSILITDEAGPIGLAGIMGGQRTSVSACTKNVFLESAFFSPISLSGKARTHGLSTDASHRFERGVDWEGQELALNRAIQLLQEIAGGEAGPLTKEVNEKGLPKIKIVNLRQAQIERVLGIAIEKSKIERIFSWLGLVAKFRDSRSEKVWEVSVPPHRFDINLEIDLIEEIGRSFGYDRLPSRTLSAKLEISPPRGSRSLQKKLAGHLVSRGYNEAITYSFVDAQTSKLLNPEENIIRLANPLSSEMSSMRNSMWPGLLKAVLYNLNRQKDRVRLFEIGLCFNLKKREDGLSLQNIRQEKKIAFVATGRKNQENWTSEVDEIGFFDLKGDLESLLLLAQVDKEICFARSSNPAFHPGQSTDILIGGKKCGMLGQLISLTQKELGLREKVFLCEIDLSALGGARVVQSKKLSKFPGIRRDLSFIVDRETEVSEMISLVKQCSDLLKDLIVFDVYQGDGIDLNRKSIGLGLTFQDASRTLTDVEVDSAVSNVVNHLRSEMKAELRD
ncbi:MAG: phenylalanine--tRNA ligase subunit beta [Pseudomonadota bacterium]|nr:phenylalanine--tRNA ligase subunit beta [Pseudomonadota bacterium]